MSTARLKKKQQSDTYEPARRTRAVHTIELAREYLANPRVIRSLGGLAYELIETANLLEVPTIRNGKVRMLSRYRERDAVPFVVMRRGETLLNPMLEYGPSQRQTMDRLAADLGSHHFNIPAYHQPQEHVIDGDNAGVTWGVPTDRKTRDRLTRAEMRPFVGVLARDARYMALTAVHEIAHVTDFLQTPITDMSAEDFHLSTELKAYSVAHVVDALTAPDGHASNLLAARVAALRERHNGSIRSEDAFVASNEVRSALEARDLTYLWRS